LEETILILGKFHSCGAGFVASSSFATRLTYERVFLPVQDLWRDFLVHCEEIGSGLPTANQFSTGKMTEAQGRMHSSMAQLSYDEPLRTTIAEP